MVEVMIFVLRCWLLGVFPAKALAWGDPRPSPASLTYRTPASWGLDGRVLVLIPLTHSDPVMATSGPAGPQARWARPVLDATRSGYRPAGGRSLGPCTLSSGVIWGRLVRKGLAPL